MADTEALPLRPDFRRTARRSHDTRAPERLRLNYELERRLADRLRGTPQAERAKAYTQIYDEFYSTLDDVPQKTKGTAGNAARIARELALLRPHLASGTRFLEMGAGDALVSLAVAKQVLRAYALDVTDELIDKAGAPPNFEFLRTGGIDIPLRDASVDVAYSNQMMEHLHPDDAAAQLREIRRVLAPGGVYRCSTPNRLSGPHDISKYFEYSAAGLHLREYDYRLLRALFLEAGFRTVQFRVTVRHLQAPMPFALASSFEVALSALPDRARAFVGTLPVVRQMLGLTALGCA